MHRKHRKISRKSHKVNKQRRSKPSMAKRRSRTRTIYRKARRSYSRGRTRITGALTGGIVGDMMKARGTGQVLSDVAGMIYPQARPIAKIAGEYLGGGFKGLALAEIEQLVTGQESALSQFGGLIPQLGGSGNGEMSV